jgi:hypothetical protein
MNIMAYLAIKVKDLPMKTLLPLQIIDIPDGHLCEPYKGYSSEKDNQIESPGRIIAREFIRVI